MVLSAHGWAQGQGQGQGHKLAHEYKNITLLNQLVSCPLLNDKFKNRFKVFCILCLSRRKFKKLQIKAVLYNLRSCKEIWIPLKHKLTNSFMSINMFLIIQMTVMEITLPANKNGMVFTTLL